MPHITEAEKQKAESIAQKEKLAALRKAGSTDKKLEACRDAAASAEKAAREAQAKADAIDAAVYDLKAVNPRVRVETDTRTATEIIESIEQHGKTVADALEQLKKLLRD